MLGREHKLVALTINNLASVYRALGRYADAEPLFDRALRINQSVYGSRHPETATVLANLAELYKDQGRYAEAESLIQRALAIRKRTLGLEHRDTAGTLNNLACLYNTLGRYAEAETLHLQALAIREKVLGSGHPLVAESVGNLALVYQEQARYRDAEPLHKRALAIREKALGLEHPATLVSLNNLGAFCSDRGRYEEAEATQKRVLEIRERTLSPDHPDIELLWKMRPDSRSEAIRDLNTAMELAESLRWVVGGSEFYREWAVRRYGKPFELMVRWQTELANPAEGFLAMERCAACSLTEQMQMVGVDLLKGLPPDQATELKDRELACRAEVGRLDQQLQMLGRRTDLPQVAKREKSEAISADLAAARDKLFAAYTAIRHASPLLRQATGRMVTATRSSWRWLTFSNRSWSASTPISFRWTKPT
jgi:tetratricopeptide (TPR) repeat protein